MLRDSRLPGASNVLNAIQKTLQKIPGSVQRASLMQSDRLPARAEGAFSWASRRAEMARRAGRPRKDRERREPPRSSDLLREKRACAITGEPPRLAEIDRAIMSAWALGDLKTFTSLTKERDTLERLDQKRAKETPTALGILRARGQIDDRLFFAGETYEKNQRRLHQMACAPGDARSHLQDLVEAAPAVYFDLDPDRERSAYDRCRWVEREIAARCWDWRLLDRVVVQGELPRALNIVDINEPAADAMHAARLVGAKARLVNLRHDLEEIAKFFEKPPSRDRRRRPPAL